MRAVLTVAVAGGVACLLAIAAAQGAAQPQTVKGLQIAVSSVTRAPSASLRDCPPGTNTVNATTRPGEQFAVVTVSFKALAGFQASPMKRPTVTDMSGKVFNTSVQFVDVGSQPEFSCAFLFRVPDGTKLKALQIESATFDVSTLDAKAHP